MRAPSDMPATDMAKAYQMFQIAKEEKLFSVYQCSVRRARAPLRPAPLSLHRLQAAQPELTT